MMWFLFTMEVYRAAFDSSCAPSSFPYLKSERYTSTMPSRSLIDFSVRYMFEFQTCGRLARHSFRVSSTKGRFDVGSPPTQLMFLACPENAVDARPPLNRGSFDSIFLANLFGLISVPGSGLVLMSQFWQYTQLNVHPEKKTV